MTLSTSTKIKVSALALLLGLTLVSPDLAFAQAQGGGGTVNSAAGVDCTQWQIDQGLCEGSFRGMVLKLLNFFLLFLGLAATAVLIYGGFLYVTSAGNDENVGKAKKILIYSAVGIIVVLLATALVNTLLGASLNQTSAQQ